MMNKSRGHRLGRIFVKSLAVILSQLVVHAGPNKGAGHAAFPAVNLPAVTHGRNAVQSLVRVAVSVTDLSGNPISAATVFFTGIPKQAVAIQRTALV
jgi:hypothetical protein